MASRSDFPATLLNAPPSARLKHFQEFTVAHPRLVDTKDRLLAAIRRRCGRGSNKSSLPSRSRSWRPIRLDYRS